MEGAVFLYGFLECQTGKRSAFYAVAAALILMASADLFNAWQVFHVHQTKDLVFELMRPAAFYRLPI